MASAIDSLLTCAICIEDLTAPKMLPCGHSFCLPCLQALLRESGDMESGCPYHLAIVCPTCRYDVWLPDAGVNGLPDDFKVTTLLEARTALSNQVPPGSSKQCDICSGVGSVSCLHCHKSMCQTCLGKHAKRKDTARHTVLKLSDVERCEEHGDFCSHVCGTCSRLVCVTCLMDNCATHEASEISEAAHRYGHAANTSKQKENQNHENIMDDNQLLHAVVDLHKQSYEAHSQHYSDVGRQIREHVEKIITDVRTRGDELQASLRDLEAETRFTMEEQAITDKQLARELHSSLSPASLQQGIPTGLLRLLPALLTVEQKPAFIGASFNPALDSCIIGELMRSDHQEDAGLEHHFEELQIEDPNVTADSADMSFDSPPPFFRPPELGNAQPDPANTAPSHAHAHAGQLYSTASIPTEHLRILAGRGHSGQSGQSMHPHWVSRRRGFHIELAHRMSEALSDMDVFSSPEVSHGQRDSEDMDLLCSRCYADPIVQNADMNPEIVLQGALYTQHNLCEGCLENLFPNKPIYANGRVDRRGLSTNRASVEAPVGARINFHGSFGQAPDLIYESDQVGVSEVASGMGAAEYCNVGDCSHHQHSDQSECWVTPDDQWFEIAEEPFSDNDSWSAYLEQRQNRQSTAQGARPRRAVPYVAKYVPSGQNPGAPDGSFGPFLTQNTDQESPRNPRNADRSDEQQGAAGGTTHADHLTVNQKGQKTDTSWECSKHYGPMNAEDDCICETWRSNVPGSSWNAFDKVVKDYRRGYQGLLGRSDKHNVIIRYEEIGFAKQVALTIYEHEVHEGFGDENDLVDRFVPFRAEGDSAPKVQFMLKNLEAYIEKNRLDSNQQDGQVLHSFDKLVHDFRSGVNAFIGVRNGIIVRNDFNSATNCISIFVEDVDSGFDEEESLLDRFPAVLDYSYGYTDQISAMKSELEEYAEVNGILDRIQPQVARPSPSSQQGQALHENFRTERAVESLRMPLRTYHASISTIPQPQGAPFDSDLTVDSDGWESN